MKSHIGREIYSYKQYPLKASFMICMRNAELLLLLFFFFSRKESFIIRSLHHKTLAVLFEQVNIRLVRLFFLEKNLPDNRYSRVNEILNKRYFKLKVTAITENMLVSSLKNK